MKYLRKSPLIIVILLGIWLWNSYSYSITVECSCCSHNDYQRGCSKKGCEDQLSLTHKKHREGNHHHQEKNQCHQEDNNCSCVKCGNPYADEMVLKVYWTGEEKKQVLTPGQNILERKIPLPEDIFTYQERKPTTKFLSLFLLKSSFLL